MRSFRLILVSGLLTGIAAHAQAAPDWSAYIGTGHAADGHNSTAASSAPLEPAVTASHSSTLHWSAFIGTGQAAANSYRRREEPYALNAPGPRATLNWSANIGTGHSADAVRTR
jgi:hypothetical protein